MGHHQERCFNAKPFQRLPSGPLVTVGHERRQGGKGRQPPARSDKAGRFLGTMVGRAHYLQPLGNPGAKIFRHLLDLGLPFRKKRCRRMDARRLPMAQQKDVPHGCRQATATSSRCSASMRRTSTSGSCLPSKRMA